MSIRAAPSRFDSALGASGDVTQALHARTEVYLGGLGWVPADPADALKLADAGVPDTLRREVDAFLLGGAEANWIAYNHARDFRLEPPAAGAAQSLYRAPTSRLLAFRSASRRAHKGTASSATRQELERGP